MKKYYVVMAINQGTKGVKGVYYLSDLEELDLSRNQTPYIFKNEEEAKKYANTVEENHIDYDLIVSVQEVELCAEGIKPLNTKEIEGGNEMNEKQKAVIEAFQYDGDFKNQNGEYYIPQWGVEAHENGVLFFDGPILKFKAPEGDKVVNVGDYIIKGITGGLYPCVDGIFETTYRAVATNSNGWEEFIENENKLHQAITEDLFGAITRIAELSVNEHPSTQHGIKSRLKSIIDSEIELAWSVAKLTRNRSEE